MPWLFNWSRGHQYCFGWGWGMVSPVMVSPMASRWADEIHQVGDFLLHIKLDIAHLIGLIHSKLGVYLAKQMRLLSLKAYTPSCEAKTSWASRVPKGRKTDSFLLVHGVVHNC